MKTPLKAFVTAAIILLGISNSFAAMDVYLKISGGGKSKLVRIKCPDGTCTTSVDGLKPGKYSIGLCNAQGSLMKAKEKANQTKCVCTLTYIATNNASENSSGLAAGKRQHAPITFTKTIDAMGTFVVPADLDGDGFTFQKIIWTWTDGSKAAQDDWSVSK